MVMDSEPPAIIHVARTNAQELRESLRRNPDIIPPFEAELMNKCASDMNALYQANFEDMMSLRAGTCEDDKRTAVIIQENLSESEVEFFHRYCSALAEYQMTFGESGVNLMLNVDPPISLFVQVRTLVDYGEFETSDGTVVMLKKNSIHSLLRQDCELLIRQGVLEYCS